VGPKLVVELGIEDDPDDLLVAAPTTGTNDASRPGTYPPVIRLLPARTCVLETLG
jgi:hypothetical protein